MTLEDFDQTLQTYTQGGVSTSTPDVPIYGIFGWGGQVPSQVGIMTGGVTKIINCGAAGALAFSPIPTPDDAEHISDTLLDQGTEGVEKGLEAASKLTKLGKKARGLAKAGGKAANVASKALAVHSAYKNMQDEGCFGGKK